MSDKLFTLAAFADEASNDIEGQIAALKRNGLRLIELRTVGDKNCADLTENEASELKKRLEADNIAVKTIGSPIGKISVTGDFDKEKERFLRLCEISRILGADKMRIFSFYREDSLSEEDGRKYALERLNALSELSKDILLCNENEKDVYGDNPEFCKEICEKIPGIRAIFDPSNFVQCGFDTLPAWEMLKPCTAYLHLKDSLKSGVVVPCGKGEGNVPFILNDYISSGGSFATIEPHLFEFAARGSLEKNASKFSGSDYENADAAFDAGVNAVKEFLKGKVIIK
ncbi:MAG: sugar phosphate isomerase/epimerase [Clostridiales bacterium]|nr:sugar phosphate isomerase/epimerase [Candidatus Equinaster intestinalis]